MKKRTLVIFALLFITANAFSQNTVTLKDKKKHHDILLRVGIGYAIPQAGQTYSPDHTLYSGNMYSTSAGNGVYTSYNEKPVSFSSGLHGYIGGSYMFNKNIGLDLAADLGIVAKKYTASFDYNTTAGIQTITQQSRVPIVINPSILFKTANKGCNLYMRTGLSLPVIARVDIVKNYAGIGTETDKIRTGFSLGFTAATGISCNLSQRLKFWAEVSGMSMALYIKEIKREQYPTPIKYSFSGGTINSYPTYSLPYSNIGVNTGISFSL